MSKVEAAARIREIAAREGPISSWRLAKVVARSEVYPDEVLDQAKLRWIQSQCRRALNEKGPDGTPLFGQVWAHDSAVSDVDDEDGDANEKKAPLWMLKEQMSFPEMAAWIEREISGVRADYAKVEALCRYSVERFGKAPAIPALVDPS